MLSSLVGKQDDDEAWGDAHKANTDEGRGPFVLTPTSPWSRLWEGSKDAHSISSPGQCFALPLVLPVPLVEKLLGSRCKSASFSLIEMTHPTYKGKSGTQLLCSLLFKLFMGVNIGPHALWLRAVRHPRGPLLRQLAKLHRLPKAKPKLRPFYPQKSIQVMAPLTAVASGLPSSPKGCSPPSSNSTVTGKES